MSAFDACIATAALVLLFLSGYFTARAVYLRRVRKMKRRIFKMKKLLNSQYGRVGAGDGGPWNWKVETPVSAPGDKERDT